MMNPDNTDKSAKLPLMEMETVAREFWQEVEYEAARLEVTVDYYLMEFY